MGLRTVRRGSLLIVDDDKILNNLFAPDQLLHLQCNNCTPGNRMFVSSINYIVPSVL